MNTKRAIIVFLFSLIIVALSLADDTGTQAAAAIENEYIPLPGPSRDEIGNAWTIANMLVEQRAWALGSDAINKANTGLCLMTTDDAYFLFKDTNKVGDLYSSILLQFNSRADLQKYIRARVIKYELASLLGFTENTNLLP